MSLITTPSNLVHLVREAETDLQMHLDRLAERERVALGAMAARSESDAEAAENIGFSMFSLLAPGAVSSSPTARIFSNGGYQQKIRAAALQGATSQVARAQRMEDEMAACFWDFFFKTHAAAFIETCPARMADLTKAERESLGMRSFEDAREAVEESSDDVKAPRATAHTSPQTPARWPRIKALRVGDCGYDTRMGTFSSRRFSYHSVIVDHDELVDTARENSDDWISAAVSAMPTHDDLTSEYGRASTAENRYVKYYVVYVPGGTIDGEDPKPGQPGVIYTVASSGAVRDNEPAGGIEIRRPYYWNGHPDGPHIFRGQFITGESSFFLNILAANEEALAMTEAASASLLQRIRDYKVVNVYDAAEHEEAMQIANQSHGGWVGVPGWREGRQFVQQVETGAPSPAEVQNLALMQNSASRNLGMDEVVQGRAARGTTATASSIAANSTKTRLDYLFSRWAIFLRDCMERLAYEIAHNHQVLLRLDESGREGVLRAQLEPLTQRGILTPEGVEAIVQDMKAQPMLLKGGDFGGEDEAVDWYALDIMIDPTSMEGEFGERSLSRQNAWNEVLAFIGDRMIQQPHIRWIDRARKTGRALGMTDCEMAVDLRKAQEMSQIQLSQAAPQPTTGPLDTQKMSAEMREAGGGASSPRLPSGNNFDLSR